MTPEAPRITARKSRTVRISEAADAWRESGRVRHPSDVAAEFGLSEHDSTYLQRLVPELALPAKRDQEGTTRDYMVAAVRAVAERNGLTWMSTATYDKLRVGDEPSGALITSRHRWTGIAADAGLDMTKAKPQAPGFGEKQFSDDDVDRAVLEFLHSVGRRSLAVAEFEHFLMGRDDLPSVATVRNRFRRKRGITSISEIYADVQRRTA